MTRRVAAVDCGTNSLRLLVADVDLDRAELTDVARRMEIVRLGEGVDQTGRLAPEALARTAGVLRDYAEVIAGTAAEFSCNMRGWQNSGRFLELRPTPTPQLCGRQREAGPFHIQMANFSVCSIGRRLRRNSFIDGMLIDCCPRWPAVRSRISRHCCGH